jgi:hypothetical protein
VTKSKLRNLTLSRIIASSRCKSSLNSVQFKFSQIVPVYKAPLVVQASVDRHKIRTGRTAVEFIHALNGIFK